MTKKIPYIFLFLLSFALACPAASIEEAEDCYRSKDMENAILFANQVAIEAESRCDTTTLAKAWSILGMCYAERGDVLQVAKYTKQMLGIVDNSIEEFSFVSSSLYTTARIYRRSNQPEEALKYLHMCMVYESELNRVSVLVQRHLELAEVYCDMKNWKKALSVTESALEFYTEDMNGFVLGSLYYRKAVCEHNLGNDDAALSSLRKSYSLSINHVKSYDRVMPQCYLMLAEFAAKEHKADSAAIFYNRAIQSSKFTGNWTTERDAYIGLGGVTEDAALRDKCRRCADSLSYAPYVSEFAIKCASSLIDFPKKEREQTIQMQTNIVIIMSVLIVIVLLLAASLTYNARHFHEKAKLEAEKNAALAESNRQKDRLLALASAAVEEKERYEIKKLAKTMGDPEEIKLTKREREVAKYASEGLQNKEIAEKLGINTRTVEAHRNSLYRKLGINNAIELSNYMNRVKYMSDNSSES